MMNRLTLAGLALFLTSLAVAETEKAPADPEVLEQQLKEVQTGIQDAYARHRKQRQVLEKSKPVQALAAAAREADAVRNRFLATDPALQKIQKQRDEAGAAIRRTRDELAQEDKEGAANRKALAENYEEERKVNYDAFIADQVYHRKVRDPLHREDEEILAAAEKRNKAEEALRAAQHNSASIKEAHLAIRRAQLAVDILRAQTSSSRDLARAEKAVHDAREAYNELRNSQDATTGKKNAEKAYNELLAKTRDADPALKELGAELEVLSAKRNNAHQALGDLRNRLHHKAYPEADKDPRLHSARQATQEARTRMYKVNPEGQDSRYERLVLERARLDWAEQQKKADASDEETGTIYNALRQAQAAYDARVESLSQRPEYRKAKEANDRAAAAENETRKEARASSSAVKEINRDIDALNETVRKVEWEAQQLRWRRDVWERPRVDRNPAVTKAREEMYRARRKADNLEREIPRLKTSNEKLADAQRTLRETRESFEASPEMKKAKEALEAARKTQAERVAALPESIEAEKARKNEVDVRKAREESSSGFKAHQAKREQFAAQRKKIHDARNELNREWGRILARVEKEHPDVLAARKRYEALAKTYNEAAGKGRAAELGKVRHEAWQAYHAKVRDLATEDAESVAIGKEIEDLRKREREIRHAIAQAKKPAE